MIIIRNEIMNILNFTLSLRELNWSTEELTDT